MTKRSHKQVGVFGCLLLALTSGAAFAGCANGLLVSDEEDAVPDGAPPRPISSPPPAAGDVDSATEDEDAAVSGPLDAAIYETGAGRVEAGPTDASAVEAGPMDASLVDGDASRPDASAEAGATDAGIDPKVFVVSPALDGVPLTAALACTATASNVGTPSKPSETIAFTDTITFHFVASPGTVTYRPALRQKPFALARTPVTVPTSKLRLDHASGPGGPLAFKTTYDPGATSYPNVTGKCPLMPVAEEFVIDSAACLYAVGALCGHARPTCWYTKYLPYTRYAVTETAASYTYEVRDFPSSNEYYTPKWSLSVTRAPGKLLVQYDGGELHGTLPETGTSVRCTGEVALD